MKSLIAVALIFLLFVLGCGMMSNIIKKNSTNFSPYQGKLSDLLPLVQQMHEAARQSAAAQQRPEAA